MNKCITIVIRDWHSPSFVLYYNNENEDNVGEIKETCHFGNQNSVPHNDTITSNTLSLYWIGQDESNQSTFRLH